LSLRKKYNQVEWKKIAGGLRDILIREYFSINYRILWDIVKNKILLLKEKITEIIEKEKRGKNIIINSFRNQRKK